ncbi:MAG: glycosyl transferase family 1 [Dehalococcoidia bacterium]|nr:MAG: glycosyl transferase family 1 [Dehalococcoidia bacterium]
MRIGIDARPLADRFPGIGRYLAGLIPALMAADPALQLALFIDPAARGGRLDPAPLAGERGELVPLVDPIFSPHGQWHAARVIDRYRLDLLHAPYFLLPLGLRTPFVVTIHDLIPLSHPEVLPGRLARLLYPFALALAVRTARLVLADSQWVATDLAQRGLVAPERVVVVPAAADALPPPSGLPLPPEWPRPPYLLSVAADKPLKNLPFLVRAYAASGVTLPLVLAGPPDPRHLATVATIRALGLEGRVVRLGAVPEAHLGDLYRGALAFLFPSLAEGFGLPPLEAMQAGVPVVASTATSLPEVLGDAALLVPPNDEAGWARALRRVVEDGALRATLAAAGRERARRFSWQRSAEAVLAAYRRALGQSTPSTVR